MTDKKSAPMSPAKTAALAKAQAASKASLEYGSPRQRGFERAHEAIEWVYKWGWSTPTVLEINAGKVRSGLANRLVKSGIMNRIENASGGINNTPTFLLTLTEKGLEKAVEITDLILPYETDPHRINFRNVNHDELVQRVTAIKMWLPTSLGGIDDFRTPKYLHKLNSNEIKIPDVIWHRKNQSGNIENFAVEFELSLKKTVEFDRFITMTTALLGDKRPDGQNAFNGIEIFFKSPTLLKNYSEAFKAGGKTPLWIKEKGKTGRWKQKTDKNDTPIFFTMSEKNSDMVKFTLITPEMIQTQKTNY